MCLPVLLILFHRSYTSRALCSQDWLCHIYNKNSYPCTSSELTPCRLKTLLEGLARPGARTRRVSSNQIVVGMEALAELLHWFCLVYSTLGCCASASWLGSILSITRFLRQKRSLLASFTKLKELVVSYTTTINVSNVLKQGESACSTWNGSTASETKASVTSWYAHPSLPCRPFANSQERSCIATGYGMKDGQGLRHWLS